MHRVDADGYITVLGERRFVDRSLPTYEGTVDGANWNNAVQEEIATVIEHAGLTLRSTGAADASAGWDQLKEAIFDSGAIGNDALASTLSLDKFSQGTIDITNGLAVPARLYADEEKVIVGNTSQLSTIMDRKGLRFHGTGNLGINGMYLRWAIYDITGYVSGASVDDAISGTTDSHYHKIGEEYDNIYDTEIDITANILGTQLIAVLGAGNSTVVNAEVEFSGSTTWEVARIIQMQATSSDKLSAATSVYLVVFFDGNSMLP